MISKRYSLNLILASLCMAEALKGSHDLLVETSNGWIRGIREKVAIPTGEEADCWFGIPYAEPPLGDLRFRHPQRVKKWSGIRDAAERPNSCVQLKDTYFPDFDGAEQWNANTPMSEDCLYLNVVAPSNRNRKEKLAVLIWIYGGGFYSGTSTLDVYDPRTFAVTENVIVVSMQYRVASLGFLFFGNNEAPGNAGLFDQLMALEFVKENVERFGGDPNSITLFGESAGAASVTFHLMSPLSENLFHRAILQSGSGNAKWATIPKETSVQRGLVLAEQVNCPHDKERLYEVAACLRTVNASTLVKNEWSTDGYKLLEFPFSPVVDGVFLEDDPTNALKNGRFKNVPLIIGTNQEEGYYFLIYYFRHIFKREENVGVDRAIFLKTVEEANPELDEAKLKAVVFEYTDWIDANDPVKNRDSLDKMVGDKHIACAVNDVAQRYAETGNKVYKYYFTQRSSQHYWPSWTGVLHADEISFVFGKPLQQSLGYTTDETEFSKLIMRYWANFAKTGNPNLYPNGTVNKVNWPAHTTYGREYLELNDNSIRTPSVGRGPRLRQCAFWNHFLPEMNSKPTSTNTMTKAQTPQTREQCQRSTSNGNVRSQNVIAVTLSAMMALMISNKD